MSPHAWSCGARSCLITWSSWAISSFFCSGIWSIWARFLPGYWSFRAKSWLCWRSWRSYAYEKHMFKLNNVLGTALMGTHVGTMYHCFENATNERSSPITLSRLRHGFSALWPCLTCIVYLNIGDKLTSTKNHKIQNVKRSSCWAVVVARLVERSLPISEVRSSNPVFGKFYSLSTSYKLFWKD